MLSLATTLQQPTTKLTLHAHQNALHTHHYPLTTKKKHIGASGGKMAQDVEMV